MKQQQQIIRPMTKETLRIMELAQQIQEQPFYPEGLRCTLRRYQEWGVKYALHQQRALLGDEMGLGKTVQAIAAMAALAAEEKSHFMVVCPASVLINWCREVQKFSTLEVTKIHGNDEKALQHWLEAGGVAVTTYESISRFALPEKFKISMVVVDEAHYVKNPDTQRTKALLKLLKKTEYTLFMSGTPLENRVEEMCFLVSCLQPEIAKELEKGKLYRFKTSEVKSHRTIAQNRLMWAYLEEIAEADYTGATATEGFETNGEFYTVLKDKIEGVPQSERREIRRRFHSDYIEAKRFSEAKNLLGTGQSVQSACLNSGFSDCSYFIMRFRKRFGITPSQYQKEIL